MHQTIYIATHHSYVAAIANIYVVVHCHLDDLTPSPSSKDDSTPYPDGHGKGPLEDIIIVISVVIIITISVIISVGLSWKRGKFIAT